MAAVSAVQLAFGWSKTKQYQPKLQWQLYSEKEGTLIIHRFGVHVIVFLRLAILHDRGGILHLDKHNILPQIMFWADDAFIKLR